MSAAKSPSQGLTTCQAPLLLLCEGPGVEAQSSHWVVHSILPWGLNDLKILASGDYGGAQVPDANQLLGHTVWGKCRESLKNGLRDSLLSDRLGRSAAGEAVGGWRSDVCSSFKPRAWLVEGFQ